MQRDFRTPATSADAATLPEIDSESRPGAGSRLSPVPVRPVRRAFEQVADQLRALILSGDLARDSRLPNEAMLARQFRVSRGTVREALRLLAAQSLIRTAKGAAGGSYVTLPTVAHISEFVQSSINLLAESRSLTLADFLEAREVLEVPLVRLAALRRNEPDLAKLRATIPDEPLELSLEVQTVHNKGFHSVLIESCGNTLLKIAAEPVLTAFQQIDLAGDGTKPKFLRMMNEQHRSIEAAIASGDAAAAEGEMRSHLDFLRPFYEEAWEQTFPSRARA